MMPGILSDLPKPTSSSQPEGETKSLFVVGKPKNLIEPGNLDLLNRPQVSNEDGSVSTVLSMSFYDPDSEAEVLIPRVSLAGTILSEDEAVDNYYSSGQHLGKFKTPEAASKYAQELHNQQQSFYGR